MPPRPKPKPISVRCYVGPGQGMNHAIAVFVGPGDGRRGLAGSLTVIKDELEDVVSWLESGPLDVQVYRDEEESHAAPA